MTQAQSFPMPHPWVNYCHFIHDYVGNSALEPTNGLPKLVGAREEEMGVASPYPASTHQS